ncbi:MAG: efflux RND transporter periplasmic adaptor subunit [Gemmatimonadaceae bacterium]
MSKRAKIIIAGVALVAVAGLGGLAAMKRGTKPVDVRIEKVGRHDLIASVTASGQVQPRTKVDVASDISGRIVRLSVREGQLVTKGQFLLQIDPEQYAANVQRSEAQLASARAQEAQARANYLGAQRSYERSAAIKKANAQLVSDEQLDQLKTSLEVQEALYESAKYSVQQSMAGLRDARQALSKTTIVAPMSGRVTRLNVEEGETAVPGTFNKDAATLLTISDMSVLETKVKVDETDVGTISVGDSAEVQLDAFPDTTFAGRVVKISNSSVRTAAAQGQTEAVDYEITIELLNAPEGTRPDFSATAKVVTDARSNVLAIPIIALTVRENEDVAKGDTAVGLGKARPKKEVGKRDVEGVFVVGKDNRVTFRPVQVGIAGDKYFEVMNGLREGDMIVAGTYLAIRELKDSTLVKAQQDPKEKGATKKEAGK